MEQSTARQRGKLIHPRLPDDLHEEVTAYAEANGRSITNAVVYLVRKGLSDANDATTLDLVRRQRDHAEARVNELEREVQR